jgi:hypothetical protein
MYSNLNKKNSAKILSLFPKNIAGYSKEAKLNIEMMIDKLSESYHTAMQGNHQLSKQTALAEFMMAKFLINDDFYLKALEKWVKLLDESAILKQSSFSKKISSSFSDYVQLNCLWRELKIVNNYISNYSLARVKLSERLKLEIPKAALKFVSIQLEKQENNDWIFNELIENKCKIAIRNFLYENAMDLICVIALKLNNFKNIENYTEDDLINHIFEDKVFKDYFLDIIYFMLVGSVFEASSFFWCFVDKCNTSDIYNKKSLSSKIKTKIKDDGNLEEFNEDKKNINDKVKEISDSVDDNKTELTKLSQSFTADLDTWGEFKSIIKLISELPLSKKADILIEIGNANEVIWLAGNELMKLTRAKEVLSIDARKKQEKLERDLKKEKVIIDDLKKQVEKLKKKVVPTQQVNPMPDQTGLLEEVRQLKKELEINKQTIDKKNNEVKGLKDLLDAALSINEVDEQKVKAIPFDEIKQVDGVVIGGHYKFINKLRKELPNCLFYLPDQRSVEENHIKNSKYMLLYTNYVNHNITGNAIRIAKKHSIPVGYIDNVNMEKVIEEITRIYSRVSLGMSPA